MRNPSKSSSSSFPSSKPQQQSCITGAASAAAGKTTPCCTKVGLKRGPWTPEEDELLATYINREGEGRWRTLPKKAGLLRCGKSCRLRWMNYLRPSVKRGHIAPDEEDLILRLHRLLGNRFLSPLSKKLISQGIDPRTHKPLESNFNTMENKASSSNSRLNHHDHHRIPVDPNSNHAPSPLKETQANGSSNPIGGGIRPDHDHQYHIAEITAGKENVNLQNNDDADHDYGMDLRRSHYHEGLSNEDDEDINYCTDDIFSSFLNSLINEDVFNSQNPVQQQQLQPNNVINATNCDALISSTPAFTFGPGWDAPVVACTSSLNQIVPNKWLTISILVVQCKIVIMHNKKLYP